MGAGGYFAAVAFDAPSGTADAFGGKSVSWSQVYATRAQFIFQSGDEAVQAARLAGRQILKVKIRSCSDARSITTDHRMRDTRRGDVYNIVNVDAITDRANVWMQVEGPVVT